MHYRKGEMEVIFLSMHLGRTILEKMLCDNLLDNAAHNTKYNNALSV